MRLIRDFRGDVGYAVRTLRRQPTFAVVAIATLAVALGANTAMFGLVQRILLDRLPVRDSEQLVLLSRSSPEQALHTRFAYLFFRQLNASSGTDGVFDAVLCRAVGSERVTVGTDAGGVAATGELVSGNFFEALGVTPHLGRLLSPSDDVTPGAHPVVVLSYRYWQRQFGGDASIVGSILRITGVPMTVVGISPPGFDGVDPGQAIDLRLPLAMQAEVRQGPTRAGNAPRSTTLTDHRASDMLIVGRLRAA